MPITINGTTGIAGVDGSAATPSVQGADANTGMFFPAADTVAVATGGSERLRVDSSGNVGIGTSSPLAKVHSQVNTFTTADMVAYKAYNNQAVGVYANFQNSATGTAITDGFLIGINDSENVVLINYEATATAFFTSATERMRIDASGNVGVGTTSPGVLLDVRNGSNTGGSGTWLTKVHQNTNTSGSNGLSVMNTWAASTSKVLELAVAWNGTTTGYYPVFQIDGINQRFSAIYGSGGTAAVATVYPEFQCRAWARWNASGTIAASGNVSSVTVVGTGNFTVNFTTAMPDANYAAIGSAGDSDVAGAEYIAYFPPTRFAASSVGMRTDSGGGAPLSTAANSISIFR
jgi:hypothetical protein